MDHYRDNLKHVVRPETMEDRNEATSIAIPAWAALYLRDCLKDFAAYETDNYLADIALAYVEYIEMCVFEERAVYFRIFAHTAEARFVLEDALYASASHTDASPYELVDKQFKEAF